jgi:F420-non-reducing hydrogenase small subunit
MSKPRLATVILGGCTGCHLSLLDAHEQLLELLDRVELVHSPFASGSDIPTCEIVLVEGAIQNEHDLEVVTQARDRAKTLVSLGSCATLGGIGGLRNLLAVDGLVESVYGGIAPVGSLADTGGEDPFDVPRLEKSVRPVSAVVDVDVEIPGCSPPTRVIVGVLDALLRGQEIDIPRHNLCYECDRRHEKMLQPSRDFVSDAVYAVMELEEIDPDLCFLEQGVICMGPISREGCGARCVSANVPCRGCMGSSRPDFEQGAKMVDVLGAVLPSGAIMYLDDLIGTGYRYTTAVSIFPEAMSPKGGDDDE